MSGGPLLSRPLPLSVIIVRHLATCARQFILAAACNNQVRDADAFFLPELFGVADNNGYGLKVFTFLRLCGVPFRHEHIVDASAAPRGQLPYITDDGETIGDSDAIVAFLIRKYRLTIDDALTAAQRNTNLLITRMLDDLYWVMSIRAGRTIGSGRRSATRCSSNIRASPRRFY